MSHPTEHDYRAAERRARIKQGFRPPHPWPTILRWAFLLAAAALIVGRLMSPETTP
jgi:hypothetical protein